MGSNELKILVLVKGENEDLLRDAQALWEKYFNCQVIYDVSKNLKKYLNKMIDILFIDNEDEFSLEFYETFHKNKKNFHYSVIREEVSPIDIDIFKRLADSIVYTNYGKQDFIWRTISILRRYWDSTSKEGVIIYKGIIADFLESKYLVDKKLVDLTQKESQLLKFFLTNKGSYVPKNQVFQMVWGHSGKDVTRSVDQMIFKLKKKIGNEYFKSKRNKGICFE